MSFKKIAENKRGITGSIMMLFISTIIILFILVVFALGSYVVKQVQDIKDYGKIDRIEPYKLDEAPGSGYYEREYERIKRDIQHNSRLKFMLDCEGEFNNKNMKFYKVLGLWNETNTEEIADFSKNSGCGNINSAAFLNKDYGKYFYCDFPASDCVIIEPPENIGKFEFTNNLESCGIKAELSPMNIAIFISNYCDIDLLNLNNLRLT